MSYTITIKDNETGLIEEYDIESMTFTVSEEHRFDGKLATGIKLFGKTIHHHLGDEPEDSHGIDHVEIRDTPDFVEVM